MSLRIEQSEETVLFHLRIQSVNVRLILEIVLHDTQFGWKCYTSSKGCILEVLRSAPVLMLLDLEGDIVTEITIPTEIHDELITKINQTGSLSTCTYYATTDEPCSP